MKRIFKMILAIVVFLSGFGLIINTCVDKAKRYALVKSSRDIPIYTDEIVIVPEESSQRK